MFADREEAGRRLAKLLAGRPLVDPLVLAVPRGGVTVGAALAREIGAELDVVLVRKLRAPWQEEYALGAVAEDGRVVWNPEAADLVEGARDLVDRESGVQREEIERRRRLLRSVRPEARVAGRSVIVADDGIATGSTLVAALLVVRSRGPREIIVAVPVAPADGLSEVGRHCDEVVCAESPEDFIAIGAFYEDFTQVGDDEVVRLLGRAERDRRSAV